MRSHWQIQRAIEAFSRLSSHMHCEYPHSEREARAVVALQILDWVNGEDNEDVDAILHRYRNGREAAHA